LIDMAKPGCIAVGQNGRRFGNEASLNFVAFLHAVAAVAAWLVADANFVKTYGLGMVFPGGIGLKKLLSASYIVAAPSLPALAHTIGIDPAGLQATAAAMNAYAAAGSDPDFTKARRPSTATWATPAIAPTPASAPSQLHPSTQSRSSPPTAPLPSGCASTPMPACWTTRRCPCPACMPRALTPTPSGAAPSRRMAATSARQ
jgi:hypothetical protein